MAGGPVRVGRFGLGVTPVGSGGAGVGGSEGCAGLGRVDGEADGLPRGVRVGPGHCQCLGGGHARRDEPQGLTGFGSWFGLGSGYEAEEVERLDPASVGLVLVELVEGMEQSR